MDAGAQHVETWKRYLPPAGDSSEISPLCWEIDLLQRFCAFRAKAKRYLRGSRTLRPRDIMPLDYVLDSGNGAFSMWMYRFVELDIGRHIDEHVGLEEETYL
jgi:hypothetical protein